MNIEAQKAASWKIVILLLIFFFPIGIFLLVRKVTGEKFAYAQNGRTMTILGWVFIAAGLFYLFSSIADGAVAENSVSAALYAFFYFVGGGITLVLIGMKLKFKSAKYYRYLSIVSSLNGGPIADIASAFPTTYETAYSDLEQMMKDGYFAGSYINPELRVFVLTRFDEYGNVIPGEIPQARVHTCASCGGINTILPGAPEVCQYCNSPLGDTAQST